MKEALIIFVRNPELGKVKTRIAAAIGNEPTLLIYKKLLAHTFAITTKVAADKFVFYADAIGEDDLWQHEDFKKLQQQGTDLGARMRAAFEYVFTKGYERVCIIGSDCYALTTEGINDALGFLKSYDLVLGPATDGGYYLLGMSGGIKNIFEGINWSTDKVLMQTIAAATKQNDTYTLLPPLPDVDTINDVPQQWKEELGLHQTNTF